MIWWLGFVCASKLETDENSFDEPKILWKHSNYRFKMLNTQKFRKKMQMEKSFMEFFIETKCSKNRSDFLYYPDEN